VGIPVILAIFCFAEEMPTALFHEKEKPYFLPIFSSYLCKLNNILCKKMLIDLAFGIYDILQNYIYLVKCDFMNKY
jgi:hypothetical protein